MNIYLDNNATTQVAPEVLEAMLPYFTQNYGNASSKSELGKAANNAVEDAREQVAEIINAKPAEITFTSGATESINLALIGYYQANKQNGNHIITATTEHKAVLDTCEFLETLGAKITYLPVNKFGLINLKELEAAITEQTLLITIMYANNETGVLQDVRSIGKICKEKNTLFFCDATQAIGKVKVNVESMNIDMLAFSAHKLYGPKGVGALYVKSKIPIAIGTKIILQPQIFGGNQEKGLRSGTLNVPAIVGFGKACELADSLLLDEYKRQEMLRDRLENKLLMSDNYARPNGGTGLRLPNTINISFFGLEATMIMEACKNLSFSVGSACSNGKPSHVLKAMGKTDKDILGSFRLSIGRYTTMHEIEAVATQITEVVKKLRES